MSYFNSVAALSVVPEKKEKVTQPIESQYQHIAVSQLRWNWIIMRM